MALRDDKLFHVYGRPDCVWCDKAKELLESLDIWYMYYDISKSELDKAFLLKKGYKTVPQIWHGLDYIGGYTDLAEFLNV